MLRINLFLGIPTLVLPFDVKGHAANCTRNSQETTMNPSEVQGVITPLASGEDAPLLLVRRKTNHTEYLSLLVP